MECKYGSSTFLALLTREESYGHISTCRPATDHTINIPPNTKPGRRNTEENTSTPQHAVNKAPVQLL